MFFSAQKYLNKAVLLAIISVFFLSSPLFAAMEGGNYEIYGDVFSNVEDPSVSSGGDYTLRSSAGEFGAVRVEGGTFELRGGFQALEKGSLSLAFTTTSVSLGTLSLTAVASSTVTTTISTDSSTGYSLTFDESGDLSSGLNTIDDVADGEVTAGSEEYGIRTVGGGGILAVDTAISDGLEVADSNGEVTDQETGISFRVAIGGSSRAGSYSHTITATLTVNP